MNNITNFQNMNIEMLVGQVKRGTIRLDHPLQRCAQQWSLNQKGGIISRILFGLDIIPLKICVQMNSGCELKWLIDGKQRITTVMEFMDNQFKIPSSCRYAYVEYHGKKYETVTCRGKERYKKDRSGNFIAVRDENGNEVTGTYVIDIRGKKFSDLPPELQDEFKSYNFSITYVYGCNDKRIQREIIDMNSGSKMNPAQLEMNRLGKELAQSVKELKTHPFILNCAGFKPADETNGKIERSITESLALVSFPDDWKKSYTEACDFLSENLSEENIRYITYIFDTLEKILNNGDFCDGLLSREFFIVVANFAYFLNSDYDIPNYAIFLKKWINELRHIKDIELEDEEGNLIMKSYVEEYESGTKSKPRVLSRLEYMNEALDKWLSENGTVSAGDDCIDRYTPQVDEIIENVVSEDSVDEFVKEFNLIPLIDNISDKKSDVALCSLMMVSDSPQVSFFDENVSDFSDWFKQNGEAESMNLCIDYAMFLDEILKEILEDKTIEVDMDLFDKYNVPIMISMVKKAYDEDICRTAFIKWLKDVILSYNESSDFYNLNVSASPYSNSCITKKSAMLSDKLLKM